MSGGRSIAACRRSGGLEWQPILDFLRRFFVQETYICNGHGDGGRGSGMQRVENRGRWI